MGNYVELIMALQEKISKLETKMKKMVKDTRDIIEDELKINFMPTEQSQTLFGIYTAVVISTRDPWRENGVQFLLPQIT